MSRDDKKKTAREAIETMDVRLDGLLGKLGSTLGDMLDRLEQGETGEIRKSHEVQTPRGPLRAETGIKVRLGGLSGEAPATASRPVNRPSPSRRAATAPEGDAEPRTAEVTTHTDGDRWILSAELPGVSLPEVQIETGTAEIYVETTGDRRFRLAAPLPETADPADMQAVMRNGILEISLGLVAGGDASGS